MGNETISCKNWNKTTLQKRCILRFFYKSILFSFFVEKSLTDLLRTSTKVFYAKFKKKLDLLFFID